VVEETAIQLDLKKVEHLDCNSEPFAVGETAKMLVETTVVCSAEKKAVWLERKLVGELERLLGNPLAG
jgi:hypothetical protein